MRARSLSFPHSATPQRVMGRVRLRMPLAARRGRQPHTPRGTAHAFKGREAPAIPLTDADGTTPHSEDLLYIGAIRATDGS